jgi:hypothetical protein
MSLLPQDLLAEALSYLSVCEVAFVQAVSYEVKTAAIVAAKAMLAARVTTLTEHPSPPWSHGRRAESGVVSGLCGTEAARPT